MGQPMYFSIDICFLLNNNTEAEIVHIFISVNKTPRINKLYLYHFVPCLTPTELGCGAADWCQVLPPTQASLSLTSCGQGLFMTSLGGWHMLETPL